MAKNKMKTKRALAKRVKITGTGKMKRARAFTGHNAHSKTVKQRRHLRKAMLISSSDYKRIKDLVQ